MLLDGALRGQQVPQAGICARRRTYFSLCRQRKVGKRNATPLAASLRCASGNLRCSCAGRRCGTRCAPMALRSNSRSESEHEARPSFGGRARPTPCASRHGQRGFGEKTGHRFARPRPKEWPRGQFWHPQKAAEHAKPVNAVLGLVPSTGVVPPHAVRGGKAPKATQGGVHFLRGVLT